MVELDYIIPLCNIGDKSYHRRLENVNFILKNFLAKQTDVKIHVMIVEQTVDKDIPTFISKLEIPEGLDVRVLNVKHNIFVKPWLYNIGFKYAYTDNVIVGESDVYSNKDFMSDFMGYIKKEKLKWCFMWNKVYKQSKENRQDLLDTEEFKYEKGMTILTPNRNCCEGMGVYFSKEFWWKELGGANEAFKELGANDNELAYRASQISETYAKYQNRLIHMWHPKSTLKPGMGRNSTRYNRELRTYTIARWDDITDFLKKSELGNIKEPSLTTVEEMIPISSHLHQIARSTRFTGQTSSYSITKLEHLKSKEKQRLNSMIIFKTATLRIHNTSKEYTRRIKSGFKRRII